MSRLELDGVSVSFAGLKAVQNVSFKVEPGQIVSVIGPNGAGKSTLFNAITGYVPLTAGRVVLNDTPLSGMAPHRVAALGMRRTFQNGGAFASMTVLENILTGLHARTASNAVGLALGMPRARRAEAEALASARELLALMKLEDLADRITAGLSSGQQRVVEIARAMAARTQVLLLDEPAVGLSASERDRLVAILRDLVKDGMSVVLVEHTIDLVMAISDSIVVLNYGQVIAQGQPEHIRSHPAVLEAYLGH